MCLLIIQCYWHIVCSRGSVIANFRFIFDFGAVDSTYGSQQIRQTIQDGARNTANLKYPINTNTVTVNGKIKIEDVPLFYESNRKEISKSISC
jgi:hypothetical protein